MVVTYPVVVCAYTAISDVFRIASLDLSFRILFMIIIGGVGSILGSFLGSAFIILLPIALNMLAHALSLPTNVASNLELMVFGALIIFFLIVEPHGLARLWQMNVLADPIRPLFCRGDLL